MIIYGYADRQELVINLDKCTVLTNLNPFEDIIEKHIITGVAIEPHTLIKLYLRIHVDVSTFSEELFDYFINETEQPDVIEIVD